MRDPLFESSPRLPADCLAINLSKECETMHKLLVITRKYSRKSRIFMGSMPVTRMAVCPVPMPRKTPPGAIRLIEAIEWAVTGAIRVPGMATPVPSRMRDVLWAASASVA